MSSTDPTLVRNRLTLAAARGRTAFGMYASQQAPALIEVAGRAGLDFVRIDAYHGGMGPETMGGLIRAAYSVGLTPTVRVLNQPISILSALELGAMAITVPEIDSPEAARTVVQAARYAPRGKREISRPIRTLGVSREEYFRWADEELVVGVQIESAAGLESVDEIAVIDGVDMIQSGRNDLALSLGLPGQPSHPRVLEAEERVVEAALRAGKLVSLHLPGGNEGIEYARRWAKRGVQCMTIGNDTQMLFEALQARLTAIG